MQIFPIGRFGHIDEATKFGVRSERVSKSQRMYIGRFGHIDEATKFGVTTDDGSEGVQISEDVYREIWTPEERERERMPPAAVLLLLS